MAISATDGRIAWEIAAEITTVPDILTRYGITPAEFKKKLQDKMFRKAIAEAKAIWKSDLNVEQRIRLKASFLIEDSLLDIFAMIKSENSPLATKLEAFEKLMKTANLTPKTKGEGATTNGFKINIILGESASEKVVIDAHAITADQPAG